VVLLLVRAGRDLLEHMTAAREPISADILIEAVWQGAPDKIECGMDGPERKAASVGMGMSGTIMPEGATLDHRRCSPPSHTTEYL